MYTDQTGAFPTRSRSGTRYLMILCEIDSNVIISEGLNNKTSGKMIQAHRRLMKCLSNANIRPKKHILDNKVSAEFKQEIRDHGVQYELVPKGMHRCNIAEKAIQTWKSHVIGVFSGLPPMFPLYLWDLLLIFIW